MDCSIRWIPQRHPFVLIDRIYTLTENYARTGKAITAGDMLTLSGSYLIENMAQSASALFQYRFREAMPKELPCTGAEPSPGEMYLAGIDHAKVKRCPLPGEYLETEVKLVIAIGGLARVTCQCFVVDENRKEKECIGEGSLVLAFQAVSPPSMTMVSPLI